MSVSVVAELEKNLQKKLDNELNFSEGKDAKQIKHLEQSNDSDSVLNQR